MNNIDLMLEKINQHQDKINAQIEDSEANIKMAEELKEQAEEKRNQALLTEVKIAEARQKVNEAAAKVKEAEEAETEADNAIKGLDSDTEEVETDDANKDLNSETEEETEEDKEKRNRDLRNFIIGLCIGVALYAAGRGIFKLYKESKTGTITTSQTDDNVRSNTEEHPQIIIVESEDTAEKAEFTVIDNGQDEEEAKEEVEEVEEVVYEELTTENFENITAAFAKQLEDKGINSVKKEDIIKFAAIANIDKLVEDNPELAKSLFTTQKEEYLNDAAKVIGAIVMNSFIKWNETSSTEDFVKVSDIVFGEQKENMLEIEDYVNQIANAVNDPESGDVNEIIEEFLANMNYGSLSKLDDGVGFGSAVYIALIADGIARNDLNQQNFDMLHVLESSEKYVSNIFRVYEGCTNTNTDVKVLTK